MHRTALTLKKFFQNRLFFVNWEIKDLQENIAQFQSEIEKLKEDLRLSQNEKKDCETSKIENEASKFTLLIFVKLSKFMFILILQVYHKYFWEIEELEKLVTSLQNEIQDLKERGDLMQGENKDSELLKQENETSKFTTLFFLSKVSKTILNIYEIHFKRKHVSVKRRYTGQR